MTHLKTASLLLGALALAACVDSSGDLTASADNSGSGPTNPTTPTTPSGAEDVVLNYAVVDAYRGEYKNLLETDLKESFHRDRHYSDLSVMDHGERFRGHITKASESPDHSAESSDIVLLRLLAGESAYVALDEMTENSNTEHAEPLLVYLDGDYGSYGVPTELSVGEQLTVTNEANTAVFVSLVFKTTLIDEPMEYYIAHSISLMPEQQALEHVGVVRYTTYNSQNARAASVSESKFATSKNYQQAKHRAIEAMAAQTLKAKSSTGQESVAIAFTTDSQHPLLKQAGTLGIQRYVYTARFVEFNDEDPAQPLLALREGLSLNDSKTLLVPVPSEISRTLSGNAAERNSQLMQWLRGQTGISSVTPNRSVNTPKPDGGSTKYKAAASHSAASQYKDIKADKVWQSGNKGAGVTVCVLDQPFTFGHDLMKAPIKQYNAINGTNDASNHSSDASHGTAVASTIFSGHSNTLKGIAPDANFIAVSILDDEGTGNFSDILNGMAYCIAQGADILNLSIGGAETFRHDDLLFAPASILEFARNGGFIVYASGNESMTYDEWELTKLPGIIDVAASDHYSTSEVQLARFSNRGTHVDVMAPGVMVMVASDASRSTHYTNQTSGTSFSAPIFAGVLALAKSANPNFDSHWLKQALETGKVTTLQEQFFGLAGTGLIDAEALVDLAKTVPSSDSIIFSDINTLTINHPFPQEEILLYAPNGDLDTGDVAVELPHFMSLAQVTTDEAGVVSVIVDIDHDNMTYGDHQMAFTAHGQRRSIPVRTFNRTSPTASNPEGLSLFLGSDTLSAAGAVTGEYNVLTDQRTIETTVDDLPSTGTFKICLSKTALGELHRGDYCSPAMDVSTLDFSAPVDIELTLSE